MKRAVVTALAAATVAVGMLATLLVLPTPLVTAPASALTTEDVSGRTWARDGRLRPGCHRYTFRYRVRGPYDDWTLETSVVDPRRDAVASHALMGGPGDAYDPKRGRLHYRMCRWATRPGKFRIRGLLTWYDGSESVEVRLPVGKFRLRR